MLGEVWKQRPVIRITITANVMINRKLTFGLVQLSFGNTAPSYCSIACLTAALSFGRWYTGATEDEELLSLASELERDRGIGGDSEAVDMGGGWILSTIWVSFQKWRNNFGTGYSAYPSLPSGRKIESASSHFATDYHIVTRNISESRYSPSRTPPLRPVPWDQ